MLALIQEDVGGLIYALQLSRIQIRKMFQDSILSQYVMATQSITNEIKSAKKNDKTSKENKEKAPNINDAPQNKIKLIGLLCSICVFSSLFLGSASSFLFFALFTF